MKNEEFEKEFKELLKKLKKKDENSKIETKTDIKEISLTFGLKNYEEDIHSIFYFFSNFNNNNKDKEWENFLCPKYKNLSNDKARKKYLKELKDKEIYDYENLGTHIKFFKCLYKKKQAYDFLLTNRTEDINLLYNKIGPNNRTITFKEIADTIECVGIFLKMKELNNNFEIFKYIKENIKEENLKKFQNFSDNYISIIELNQNFDSSINLYDEVNEIISKAIFIFKQDEEKFVYYQNEEEKTITLEKLKALKNKIHVKPKQSSKEQIKDGISDSYNKKYDALLFFQDIVNNMEIIYDYMRILRIKGSSLPIYIKILIAYPKVEYFLKNEEKKFDDIKNYLFSAKNDLI